MGLGFTFMHEYMDEVQVYSEVDKGTRVRMVKRSQSEKIKMSAGTEEPGKLIRRSQEGDLEARSRLVEENLPLVKSIAARFVQRGIDYEDLVQIGSIGLLKAVRDFDLNYDVRFSHLRGAKDYG